MSFLQKIGSTGYEIIFAILLANITAQVAKLISYALKKKTLNFSILLSMGGMPSSHSASVTAMATSIGLIEGWSSTLFAIAACLAFIVMVDATGLRQNAGKQATVLNQIIKELLAPEHRLNKEKLIELLGHTPNQVLIGAFWGISISLLLRKLILLSG
ncbi:MAG: divergent PAP2 family protein [Candidatus Marinimicrobia bacterium]|nr:divergent PAP2 family protein [Candidatus Neomarinimicrobiota bacterium]